MPADQGLIDAVASENIKVGAGGPSFWMNLAMKGAVDSENHAARTTGLLHGALGKKIVELDTAESLAEAIVGQQATKVAQTTPPQTGAGG